MKLQSICPVSPAANNSQPAFKAVLADKATYQAMVALRDNIKTSEKFQSVFREIVEQAKFQDIEITKFNNGSRVTKVMPDGSKMLLGFDKTDFVNGLMLALKKLKDMLR